MDVIPDSSLQTCQERVAAAFFREIGIKPDERPFHPHMTVAFKDLTRSAFAPAWAYFSGISYERTFIPSDLTLLRHSGRQWEIEGRFAFSGSPDA